MALIAEGAFDDAENCFIQVGVVIDDDRVFTSHFADGVFHIANTTLRHFGRFGIDREPNRARTSEGDE